MLANHEERQIINQPLTFDLVRIGSSITGGVLAIC